MRAELRIAFELHGALFLYFNTQYSNINFYAANRQYRNTYPLSLCLSVSRYVFAVGFFSTSSSAVCVCRSFLSRFQFRSGLCFFSISFGLLSICTSRLSAVSFFCVSCVFFQFRNGQTTRQNFTRIVSLRANANGKNRLTYYKKQQQQQRATTTHQTAK